MTVPPTPPPHESLEQGALLGVFVLASSIFATVLVLTIHGHLGAVDRLAIHLADLGFSDGLLRIASAVSNLGYEYGVLPCGVALFGWLLVLRRHRDAAVAAIAQVGSISANHLIKQALERPRPMVADTFYHEASYSFPSGHAMAVATFATLLLVLFPTLRRAGPMLLASLAVAVVGFSRVVLQVHFPSDVIGGWAAGVAWVAGVALLAERLRA